MDPASFTTFFDIAIIAIVLVSALLAFIRGFFKEAFGLISLIVALIVGYWAFFNLGHLAEGYLGDRDPILSQAAAGIVAFLLTWFIASLITHRLARRINASAVGMVDRVMGFIFGAARGALIVCAFFALYATLVEVKEDYPEWLRDTRTLPYLESGADMIRDWGAPFMAAIDSTLGNLGLPPLTGENGALGGDSSDDGATVPTDGSSSFLDQQGLNATIRAVIGSTP